jgi:hypothetical protein
MRSVHEGKTRSVFNRYSIADTKNILKALELAGKYHPA